MITHLNADMTIHGGQATTPTQNPPQGRNPSDADLQNAAQQLREAFRTDVQQQLNAAREARAAAQAARAEAAQDGQVVTVPPTPMGTRNITIRGPDGTQTVVGVPPNAFRDMIPREAVDISLAFFFTVAAIIIGLPLARAFARRMDRRSAGGQVAPEIASQLAQLNQAVDAIALEVERISEGQRFTTRILSEQRDARLPSAAER